MLNDHQAREFQDKGILFLSEFLRPEVVEKARNELFSRIEERGYWKDNSWVKENISIQKYPEGVSKLIGKTNQMSSLGALITPEVHTVINQILNYKDTITPAKNGQVLFTMPTATEWYLPHQNWHLDVARTSDGDIPGVQVFTFLDPVHKEEGGTLAVAGSHRFLNSGFKLPSRKVRTELLKLEYFKKLMSQHDPVRNDFLTRKFECEGTPVQVVEMTGVPGDLYLMDMRLLHTISPNVSDKPRVMWTSRVFVADVYEEAFGKG